jgi:hypothetical protein
MIGGFLGILSDKGERHTDIGRRRYGIDTVQARSRKDRYITDNKFRLGFKLSKKGIPIHNARER